MHKASDNPQEYIHVNTKIKKSLHFICRAMVRSYKGKTKRGKYDDGQFSKVFWAVNESIPLIKASKQFAVSACTLRRHRDKTVTFPGTLKIGHRTVINGVDIEKVLYEHFKEVEHGMHEW